MKKYYIFYHVYLFGNWKEIVIDQMNTLQNSGLLEFSQVKVGVAYYSETDKEIENCKTILESYKNVEIIYERHTSGCGESDTLEELYKFSKNSIENLKILYLHTKGVTHYKSEREENVKNWRKLMEYFLIDKWQTCVEKLEEGYDCCGVNYQGHAANIKNEIVAIKIFNGNFFWANSEYINKLDNSILWEHRYSSENWILSSNHNAFVAFSPPPAFDFYHNTIHDYKN